MVGLRQPAPEEADGREGRKTREDRGSGRKPTSLPTWAETGPAPNRVLLPCTQWFENILSPYIRQPRSHVEDTLELTL